MGHSSIALYNLDFPLGVLAAAIPSFRQIILKRKTTTTNFKLKQGSNQNKAH